VAKVVSLVALATACGSPQSSENVQLDVNPAGTGDASPQPGSPGPSNSKPAPAAKDAGAPDAAAVETATERVMCFVGAIKRGDGSNIGFEELCDALPNAFPRIQDCDSQGKCYSTFDTFPGTDPKRFVDALVRTLDTNHDGTVTNDDTGIRVHLLGFSWGGVMAVRTAEAFLTDPRVSEPRREIHRVIALDPFQPSKSLTIPKGVSHFLELRHSIASAKDCSKNALGGPYLGLVPHCAADADCSDYDYSRSPKDSFTTLKGRTYLGEEIGHCDVPRASGPIVLGWFTGQPVEHLPARVPVTP
jgi:hypothetical protein